jgi:magnesium transporter
MNGSNSENPRERDYLLSDLIKRPVIMVDEKLGRLSDLVIEDKDIVAEVTHVVVSRSFGRPPLYIPWREVATVTGRSVITRPLPDIAALEKPPVQAVLLRDYIIDKKVLDVEGRELEVVYDATLAMGANHLIVIGVDLSRRALLRRMGMRWLASLIGGHHEEDQVPWDLVEPLPENLGSFAGDIKLKVVKAEVAKMPPVDVARILEALSLDQRMEVFNGLETEDASDTLEELDPKAQRDLIAAMSLKKAAILIDKMTPGQAADVLAVLPRIKAKPLLELLDKVLAAKVQEILETQEEKLANYITGHFMKASMDYNVTEARRSYQKIEPPKAGRSYLYVVDGEDRLKGVITAAELLMADDEAVLKDMITDTPVTLETDSSLNEARKMFERYDFRALPIVDAEGRLLGVVPYRDVMDLEHHYVE